ncbi:hypothetical protein [Frankia sp. Cas3]|uniref:hypothetical protein n=1 Tax=Frankia sp. Cas3 TaxID=3073926 RepID=UPI002AD4EB37|nr:hypothetical protein [Frankia sp. Cas3]
MIIQVRVERLVLDGLPFTGVDAPALRAAVEAELSRLLAADLGSDLGSVPLGTARDRLGTAPLDLVAPITAGQVGTGAARRVAQAVRAATGGTRP